MKELKLNGYTFTPFRNFTTKELKGQKKGFPEVMKRLANNEVTKKLKGIEHNKFYELAKNEGVKEVDIYKVKIGKRVVKVVPCNHHFCELI